MGSTNPSLLGLSERMNRDVAVIIWSFCSWGDVQTAFAAHGCSLDLHVRYACDCARNGYLERFKWAQTRGCALDVLMPQDASKHGHVDFLVYLHENNADMRQAVYCAAESNQIGVVKWARANDLPVEWLVLFARAAEFGHLDMLIHLQTVDEVPWWHVLVSAATHGHARIIDWAYNTHDEQISIAACIEAVINGHLCVLESAVKQGLALSRVGYTAALHGRISVLQWLAAHGVPPSESMCLGAATNDQVEALDWLLSNGQVWTFSIVTGAIYSGSLKVIRYAIEHQRVDFDRIRDMATRLDSVRVLEWLEANAPELL